MNAHTETGDSQTHVFIRNRWRIIGWGAAVALISAPLVAMQFTREVNWTASDFAFAIIMFGGVGALMEAAVRMSPNFYYRAGVALALLAGFLLVWVNAAVGLIGGEDNPVNLVLGLVLLTALAGALIARFHPIGMARAMLAACGIQALLAVGIGILMATDQRGGVFTLILASPWLLSAAAFKGAAKGEQ